MDVVKIHIKVGSASLLYEGDKEFLTSNLSKVMSEVAAYGATPDNAAATLEPKSVQSDVKNRSRTQDMSVGTIAAKLNVGSGPDLILAAASALTFFAGKEAFTRQELLSKMQEAKSYYKKSFSSNLTKYINTLIRSAKLIEGASGQFSLSASERDELESQLDI